MGGYTYLVASLPTLRPGEAGGLTAEQFRFRCQGVLDAADLKELDAVLSGRPWEGASRFCKEWADAGVQLRNSVAKGRGAKLGVDAKPYLRSHGGYRVWLDRAVSEALAKANPLECEVALDEARWQVADDLAQADAWGLGAVLAFAAKLKLAERWEGMKEETGRGKLDELVEELEADAAASGATDFKEEGGKQ